MERNGDSGGGYESHLQGSEGGDTRDNIVRQSHLQRWDSVIMNVPW